LARMKKAKLFKKLKNNLVECRACCWHCQIAPGETGICGVRENNNGELYLLVHGKGHWAVDPVEKKPLYHFLPGSTAFSIGTLGCNFGCLFCSNAWASQTPRELKIKTKKSQRSKKLKQLINRLSENLPPKFIVEAALSRECKSIAYTYNEPAVFAEYAYETMVLAHKAGLKNIFVSNGFESRETFSLVKDFLDGVNFDLKSFNPSFYQKICRAKIGPVLDNIERFAKAGIWVEVTTLIIPGENDSRKELKQIANFIRKISVNIPWHATAFYPAYKMDSKLPTDKEKLFEAWEIGREAGLNFVYAGNIVDAKHSSTYCPKCGKVLIKRDGRNILENRIKDGRCFSCRAKIAGVWGSC